MEFSLELRRIVPQLDRICWTTVADGKVKVERVAQEADVARAIPSGDAGRQVDARLSRLASLAEKKEPQTYPHLSKEGAFDLKYMSQALQSSLHVPVKREGKPGTINFWSNEAEAFPAEAVELLEDVARLMTE